MSPVGAIDFGGTKTVVAVVARDGAVIRRIRFATPVRPSPAQAVAAIAAAWRRLAEGLPDRDRPAQAGLAAPGPYDPRTGVLRRAFDWDWRDVPLASMVAAAIGLPVAMDNDVHACCLAEMRFGAAAGCRDFAWIQFSTGVGGGLVCDGRLVPGASGMAGEVGHLVLEEDGPGCPCGRRGCVEALCSGPAIVRRHALRSGGRPLPGVEGRGAPATAQDVFEAAARGDPEAREVVDAVVRDVGRALAAVVNLVDPALLVLGGGVTESLQPRLADIETVMRERVIGGGSRRVNLVRTALGADAALLGAATLAAAEGGA